jgi:hypothetical protein
MCVRWLVAGTLALMSAGPVGLAQSTYVRTDFCEILRNPEKYTDKEVTVRATYEYWFEVSALYCLTCIDKGRAWLEFSEDLDDESERILKRGPGAGIENLTITGTFRAGHSYGHLNGYRYQFEARRVRDLVVLVKGLKPIEKVRAIEKKWACGGENPK